MLLMIFVDYLFKQSFINNFLRNLWVYFVKHKSKIFTIFKLWKRQVENQIGREGKYLRFDNGVEYKDIEFSEFHKIEGIPRDFTFKKTPKHNEVAEMMNRILLKQTRCMRLNVGLRKSF